ncbi:conserved Plasmodium protein, unknown function [Plasmodium knowlesi strain H]|uniref:Uncharacterized protein n=3 Tax=Plasmodium knowlesi TaxID=5850 RepID=A0A5K1U0J3_PLAKH|nr:conserved Plasmodium protein, unknown function [Plasmodium knowlesi strain H]OTN64536.1 Uncharacterized protein PKNOH_S130210300 [Plasmodium knowlesi]CAA9989264.1 conserved Plasmodium protein, unknown function [Plasmodium knowlesi strain H]SBO26161.1 conserved Plasmodium protein, unknown function [Plasmodium knowlesi strain H]SBO26929.1 conserved Plasmodium protein, unknown function [Plasmodium knowlesi strain H]VVS78738.1 conserved Plasmodium protein, unknown function [Plasmodium knowlesi |eukprot:XP_002261610.1 hypothetical protein, conserved in Plasmodium species [Plasmodium knowlesi strain H]
MGLAVFENDKNLSFNGVDKIVDDVYKDNLNFLLKSNKNELERKETDQFSFSIDNLMILLEEEEQRRQGERDKMKDTFQNIALQLKSVKKSVKKAEKYLEGKENGEMITDSHKTLEGIKKRIDDL